MELSSVLYILVFAILFIRFAIFGAALMRLWLDPKRNIFAKVFIWDLKVWKKFFELNLDIILSIGFGILIRILIPGVASGAVGAAVGLAISLMISIAGPYARVMRRRYAIA